MTSGNLNPFSGPGGDFHFRFILLPPPRPLLLLPLPKRPAFPLPEKILSFLFILLPFLILPAFGHLSRLLYPGIRFLPRVFRGSDYLRPPSGPLFFREMSVLILAALAVIVLQAILALILRKNGPWGEAMAVGPLFAIALYGVIRGFQLNPTDTLFQPFPALTAAAGAWLILNLIILYPHLRRVLLEKESYSEAQIRG